MHDLNLPTIADGQADGQWQTSNDGDAALGNAFGDIRTVDFSGGDVTLTAAQFRSAMTFVPSNLSATRALILPAVKRAQFIVHNADGADSITVTKGSTTISVNAGEIGVFYTDGTTNGLVGTVLATGGSGGGDPPASASDIWSNAADRVVTPNGIWSAADPVTLTDASTIAVDMSTFLNAKVTLGGNRTLGAPSNPKNGQNGCIEIIQDGTGSRTLAYHADWLFAGGTDPTLSTAAGAKDLLFYQVLSNGKTFGNLVKAVA